MLQNIGVPGLIIILIIALIMFGPSKLPELGRAFGRTLFEFKNSARELMEGSKEEPEKDTVDQERTTASTTASR